MLSVSDFDYHLPPEKIAQFPLEPRDYSKLLVVDRKTGTFTDRHFSDLATLLGPGDVLVLNNTKVFPARLFVECRGKKVELLLEKEISLTSQTVTYSALTKPGLRQGDTVTLPDTQVEARCLNIDDYTRVLEFNVGREEFLRVLEQRAHTPIPPYIKWHEDDEALLRQKYQTVFARHQGAMAAPTAGLHFTTQLLDRLKEKGVEIEYVTLHVGLGTFLPVKTEEVAGHRMHEEWYELDSPTAERLNHAKATGRKIIAVGTTVVRVLETSVQNGKLVPKAGPTTIFIYPPYRFKFVDSLITNFHTPKSTLLMLVAAFISAPNTLAVFHGFAQSLIGKAYQHALEHDYRFYSFGDAMWID